VLDSSLALAGFLAFFSSCSAIDLYSRTLGDAHLAAIVADLETDARRLAVLRIGDRNIGQVNRELLGDDAALLLGGLAVVRLDPIDAGRQGARRGRVYLDDFAGTALVAAGENDDLVALTNFRRHHSTSGASEMIFIWFLARNSRGTGPKMRV